MYARLKVWRFDVELDGPYWRIGNVAGFWKPGDFTLCEWLPPGDPNRVR
ncbi:MAG TPA: hypothetical protein VH040_14925 [Usitatibacter sp.]|jgi:hypothetical protein|nr:hypothetical protein [Usitatibacter sp.]